MRKSSNSELDTTTTKVPFAFSAANVELLKKMVESKLGKPIEASTSQKSESDQSIASKSLSPQEKSAIDKIAKSISDEVVGSKTEHAANLLSKLLELGAKTRAKDAGIFGSLNKIDDGGSIGKSSKRKLDSMESVPKESDQKKSIPIDNPEIDSDLLFSDFVSMCQGSENGGERDEDAIDDLLINILEQEKRKQLSIPDPERNLKIVLMEQLLEKRTERRNGEKTMKTLLEALAKQNQPNHATKMEKPTSDQRELAMEYFLRGAYTEDDEKKRSTGMSLSNANIAGATVANDVGLNALTDQSVVDQFQHSMADQPDPMALLGQLAAAVNGAMPCQPQIDPTMIQQLLGALPPESILAVLGQLMSSGLIPGFPPFPAVPPPDFSVPPPPLPMAPPSWMTGSGFGEEQPILEDQAKDMETAPFLDTVGPLTMSTGLNAVHSFSKAELEAQLRRYMEEDANAVPFLFGGKDWAETAGQAGTSEELTATDDRIVIAKEEPEEGGIDMELSQDEEITESVVVDMKPKSDQRRFDTWSNIEWNGSSSVEERRWEDDDDRRLGKPAWDRCEVERSRDADRYRDQDRYSDRDKSSDRRRDRHQEKDRYSGTYYDYDRSKEDDHDREKRRDRSSEWRRDDRRSARNQPGASGRRSRSRSKSRSRVKEKVWESGKGDFRARLDEITRMEGQRRSRWDEGMHVDIFCYV